MEEERKRHQQEEYIKERGAIRLYSCGQVTTGGRPTAAYAPGNKNGERPAGGYCIAILDIGLDSMQMEDEKR